MKQSAEQIEKLKSFDHSRTNIWWIFFFQLFQSILPFLAIWLLLSPDFKGKSFNFYEQLAHPDLLVGLLAAAIILWAMGFVLLTLVLKWQKPDAVTFALAFSFLGFMIIVNSLWMQWWNVNINLKIFIRFLICLFAEVPVIFFGIFLTNLLRNTEYKHEDDKQAILTAYYHGEVIPDKKKRKLDRALKYQERREKRAQEIALFEEKLNAQELAEHEKEVERQILREEKKDLREERKRSKQKKKD